MGKPISQLRPAGLPLQNDDYVEVERSGESYKVPAAGISVVNATITQKGIAELSTPEEAVAGLDPARIITGLTLGEVIKNVLRNRIVGVDGVTSAYSEDDIVLTLSVE